MSSPRDKPSITIDNLTVHYEAQRQRDVEVFKRLFADQMAEHEAAASADGRAARERAIPEGRVAL